MRLPRTAVSLNMAPVKNVEVVTTLRGIPTGQVIVLDAEPFLSGIVPNDYDTGQSRFDVRKMMMLVNEIQWWQAELRYDPCRMTLQVFSPER